MNGSSRATSLYSGYVRNIQKFYERQPIFQASLQVMLSIFTTGFFLLVAVRPTLGTISSLQKKIEDQKQVNEKLDLKIKQLTTAQGELSAKGPLVESLVGVAIPAEPAVADLAKRIEVLAIRNNLSVQGIELQGAPLYGDKISVAGSAQQAVGKDRQFVTFSVTAGGSFGDLVSFAGNIGNLDRVIRVTEVSFNKPQTRLKSSYEVSMTIKGTTYYLLPTVDEKTKN